MKKLVKLKGDKVISVLNSKTDNIKIKGFVEADVEKSEKGGWYLIGHAPKFSEEEIAAKVLAQAKVERAENVSKIIVTVDEMQFDGDETSQDRMARSIVALNDNETVQWVLADNSIKMVSRQQLREALRKAGEAQTAIWADPYKTATTQS